jgi:hypothetical protein
MYHVLDPIGIPKDPARTSVFVRGFQGVNNLRRKSTTSSSWYRFAALDIAEISSRFVGPRLPKIAARRVAAPTATKKLLTHFGTFSRNSTTCIYTQQA